MSVGLSEDMIRAYRMSFEAMTKKLVIDQSEPITEAVAVKLEESVSRDGECKIRELPYKAEIGMYKPDIKEQLSEDIKNEWVRDNNIDISGYGRSDERPDYEKATLEGLQVFCTPRKPEEISVRSMVFAMIDIMVNYTMRGHDGERVTAPIVAMDDQGSYVPKNTSTGYMPYQYKALRETKVQTYVDVKKTLVTIKALRLSPPLLPYRTVVKNEVLQLDKSDGSRRRNRVIQVSSALDVVFGHDAVYQPMKYVTSNYFGCYPDVEMKYGSVAKVVYDLNWKSNVLFGERLSEDTVMSQSDQSRWEGNVHLSSIKLYRFHWSYVADVASIDDDEYAMHEAFWRNNFEPYYPISGRRFYTKPGTKPSGTILTSNSSTWQHNYTKVLFRAYLESHGLKTGCGCQECRVFGEKIVVKQLDLDKECLLFGVSSDDYIGVETSVSKYYRMYCERNLGLAPENDLVRLGDGVEFLRMKVK